MEKMRKKRKIRQGFILGFLALGTLVSVVLVVASSALGFSVRWMFQTWTNLTMEELIYHVTAPLEGTDKGMITDYMNQCIVPVLLIVMFYILLLAVKKTRRGYAKTLGVSMIVAVSISGCAVYYFWNNLHVGEYMSNQGSVSTFIDDYYVNPAEVEITFPEQKRNLVYIFLESMEATYADKEQGGGMEENFIPELTKLAQRNEDFSGEDEQLNGGYAMPGSTWTIAGMFAQTAGLPLSVSIDGNQMDTQDGFFESAITLGDILEREGYSQTLLVGSEAKFGGRDKYFESHGKYDILDYTYAIENGWIPEDYRVWWGYEDEKLFGFAKEKLIELSEEGNPFNLTLLTADTHFEDGYVCQSCPNIYEDNPYARVMSCSERQVTEFVNWMQEQPFYENTTVVLVGDHPTMDSDFCEEVEDDYVRKAYTTYLNAPEKQSSDSTREFTTFDLFPTTIASLGASIEGNRLALGTNLFSNEQTLTERFGIEMEENELSKKSEFIEGLADVDESKIKGPEEIVETVILPGSYDYFTGILPIMISDMPEEQEGVATVLVAVWKQDDQSDLQWVQAEVHEEGNYLAEVNIPADESATGEYFIHVYVIDRAGMQQFWGNATALIN